MPTISMGFVGRKSECRKPSVSSFFKIQAPDLDLDYEEDVIDEYECKPVPQAPLGWAVTFARTSSHKLRPLRRRKSKSDTESEPGLSRDCSKCVVHNYPCMDTTAGETTVSDLSDSADDSTEAGSPLRGTGEAQTDEQVAGSSTPKPAADSHQGVDVAKREIIFRDIIVKLRNQTHQAQQAAIVAEKRAQQAETQVQSFDVSQSVHKKMLLHAERQRSMEQRKKRNQAIHCRGVKEKTEKVLLEANAIKERAEMEAAEIRARAVVDAQSAVLANDQSFTESQAIFVQDEIEELKRQTLNAAASVKAEIEAQAQAVLIKAEMCANEMKQQASVDAALQAEVLVQVARSHAEQEAHCIKADALEHALALRTKVEEQSQAKLDAAQKAQTIAEAASAAAAATAEKLALDEKKAEKQSRLQAVAAMKEAKTLEQQRAKQLQRQAAQHRNQAAHLQSIKEKAERTLQEANAIKSTAQNDVAEIRARAVVEGQVAAAAEKQALLEAHVEVEELRNNAINMKADIDAQAQAVLSEATRNAQVMKANAFVEAEAQAEASIQAAKSRAEHEALAIKASALEHALALRAKVEEQVQAKLDAAKHAQSAAEASAAAAAAKLAADERNLVEKHVRAQTASALKRAKEMEQQRAKKHQRHAMQERRIQELKQRALDEAKQQAGEESRKIKEQAIQEVASLKAQARAEAQNIKSKAKAMVRARVLERTQMLSATAEAEATAMKARAEEEIQSMRKQLDMEQSEALVQMERMKFEAHAAKTLVAARVGVEQGSDVTNVEADADWEVLSNFNIEQWDMVLV